jgi:nucleoid-associated protein YgaU
MASQQAPSSRYSGLATVAIDDRISLAQRPPAADPLPPDSIVHTVVGSETLDLLAWKYYGREDLWWRIADANWTLRPFELVAGQTLAIPPLRLATRMSAQGRGGRR